MPKETRATLVAGYELIFENSDKNSDGKLSRTEVQKMVDASFVRDPNPAPNSPRARDWIIQDYAVQDLDRDGYLTLAELLNEPIAAFDCIDKDRNTVLSQAEIEASVGRCGDGRDYHVGNS